LATRCGLLGVLGLTFGVCGCASSAKERVSTSHVADRETRDAAVRVVAPSVPPAPVFTSDGGSGDVATREAGVTSTESHSAAYLCAEGAPRPGVGDACGSGNPCGSGICTVKGVCAVYGGTNGVDEQCSLGLDDCEWVAIEDPSAERLIRDFCGAARQVRQLRRCDGSCFVPDEIYAGFAVNGCRAVNDRAVGACVGVAWDGALCCAKRKITGSR
jgi:hypothetical protein